VRNNVYGVTKMLAVRLVTWANSRYNVHPGGDQYNVQAMITKAL
jgi:hypothetical protein